MIQLYDRFSLLINWYCSINEHDMKKSQNEWKKTTRFESESNETKERES